MKQSYDLVIAGGGFTGVAASVAAAREGLSVLILEKNGYLGGAACMNYVNPFMRYYMRSHDENGEHKGRNVNAGIFSMILDRLDEMGGLHKNKVTFNEEYIKILFDRLVRENGIDLLLHTYVIGAKTENGIVKSVEFVNKSGKGSVSARYFIDSSGDGDLAVYAGCDYQLGRESDALCQPMTLCFRIANVDRSKFFAKGVQEKATELYNKLQAEGKIKNPREDILTFTHMADGVVHFNSTRIIKHNPTNTEDLTDAEMNAREQMLELYHFMKENVDGFENSTLLASAPNIGIRESRMIKGRYVMCADDIKNCSKFYDSIAQGNYEIDIHNPDGSGTEHYKLKDGEYYTIPYRALMPEMIDNLLVAGRCISSTHEAQAAYRIIPICTCIGEGAGMAIALAAKNNSKTEDIDINELHSMMDKVGALY